MYVVRCMFKYYIEGKTNRQRTEGNWQQQKNSEMHFTIIQAESCDKVKIIIIIFLITFFSSQSVSLPLTYTFFSALFLHIFPSFLPSLLFFLFLVLFYSRIFPLSLTLWALTFLCKQTIVLMDLFLLSSYFWLTLKILSN